ncbi:MAG TPA: hypothetical protein VHF65_00925 [Nitrososphaera sp.]|nr:hypothetical protein [Nitrososphaera sp.]
MQKPKVSVLTAALALAVMISFLSVTPQAFAHQRQLYTIGGQDYLIVIGSLNEPIFVDDKSGVDLQVLRADPNNPMNSSAEGATPVEGLEETVQVELAAGNVTRVLQLEPAFGEPGAYEAPFYPTVATTITYRLFGTINNTPVDLTFTCTPTGEAGAAADNSTVQISEGVIRKGIEGGYGCPAPLTDAGFPEPFVSNNEIVTTLEQLRSEIQS